MPAVVWFGFLWGVFFNDEAHLLAAAAGLPGEGVRLGGGGVGRQWASHLTTINKSPISDSGEPHVLSSS